MQTVSRLVVALALLAPGFTLVACTSSTPSSSTSSASSTASSEDKQWPMPNKNTSATRYSSLDQITTDNVKNLKVAWTFSTGVLRGHEGEPLVVGTTGRHISSSDSRRRTTS